MRQFFTFLLMVLPLHLLAQEDYLPLLEEGKWHYTYDNWATGKTYQFVEYLAGDTIVDEKNYVKNCQQDGKILNLLRKENGKVYTYNKNLNLPTETLLYDFTLEVGDEVAEEEGMMGHVVTDVSYIDFQGRKLKMLTFSPWYFVEGEGKIVDHSIHDVWVEGMGSNGGLLAPFPSSLTGNFVRLDYIEMSDGTRFSFNDIAKVGPSAEKENETKCDAFYDLQGRKVCQRDRLPKGIYIQNGRKFVVK